MSSLNLLEANVLQDKGPRANIMTVLDFVVIVGVLALVVDFREVMMTSPPNFDEYLP